MRKILRIDFLREVKKTLPRFISIAILIAIGTAFFVGLKSSAPNMLASANAYFKAHDYQDIKVISPIGFSEGDVTEFSQLENVAKVRRGYLLHTKTNPSHLIIEVLSGEEKQYPLVEGAYPTKSGEIALDKRAQATHQLGDKLTFTQTDGEMESSLKAGEYTISGFVENTRFISQNARGTTSIGAGEVDIFGFLRAEDFNLEEANTLELELSTKIRQQDVYQAAYAADLAGAKKEVEKLVKKKASQRSLDLQEELQEKITEIAASQKTIKEEKAKLDQHLKELVGKRQEELASEKEGALAKIAVAESTLADHEDQQAHLQGQVEALSARLSDEYGQLENMFQQLAVQYEALYKLYQLDDPALEGDYYQRYEEYEAGLKAYAQASEAQQTAATELAGLQGQLAKLEQLMTLEIAAIPSRATIDTQFEKLEKERQTVKKEVEAGLEELENQQLELGESDEELKQEQHKAGKLPYLVQGIDDTVTFKPFKENIERLRIISTLVPLIFFFVAFIITLTIILRMIEQAREQIGTLLAIGIQREKIMKKYTMYSVLSGAVGLVVGLFFGVFGFSKTIISLYAPMYIFSAYPSYVYPHLIIFSALATLLAVVLIPFIFYHQLFKLPALQLMQPKKGTAGLKLLLERVPVLWDKIPFVLQRTFRNIVSYRFRMLILLLGFIGCMSLLFTGYGALNSVDQLEAKQFYEVMKYDTAVTLDEFASDADRAAYQSFITENRIKSLPIAQEKWEVNAADQDRVEVFVISPERPRELSEYMELRAYQTNEPIQLLETDVFVTEKVAQNYGVTIGDTIHLINSEGVKMSPIITNIVKNYFLHYVYMGSESYQTYLNEAPVYGQNLLLETQPTRQLPANLLTYDAVDNVHTRQQDLAKMSEMTAQLNSLIVIVILASVVLGLVVLYNLAYITILERKQEIAVVKVMGLRPVQVTRYVFREILLLGGLGIVIGLWLGGVLHRFVMGQVELEFLFFPPIVWQQVALQSSLTLIVVATVLVILMHREISQMDTVEALKSRD